MDQSLRDGTRDALRAARAWNETATEFDDSIVFRSVVDATRLIYNQRWHEWERFCERCPEADATCISDAKKFVSYHVNGTRGRLDTEREKPTVNTTKNFWRTFVAAWTRETQTTFPVHVKDTVRNFIENDEKLGLLKLERPQRNFTFDDLVNNSVQLWQNDGYDFAHERYRVQTHAASLFYTYTSARVGEFYESSSRPDSGRGLDYGDIDILVWWNKQGAPHILMNMHRADPKGLRDVPKEQPHHALYEWKVGKVFLNPVPFLMALALADNVFVKYNSWEQIIAIKKPPGSQHVRLKYKKSTTSLPVFRVCDKQGPTGKLQKSTTFARQLAELGHRTGLRENITIHCIRREILLKVDDHGYSVSQRMRFAAHRNEKIFTKSYIGNQSQVDGQAVFNDTEPLRDHIEYLRGFSARREEALKHKLSATEENELYASPEWQEVERRTLELRSCQIVERQQLYEVRRLLRKDALRRSRADPTVNGTDFEDDHHSKFAITRKLMPERDRLARTLFEEADLRSKLGCQIIADLVALCTGAAQAPKCTRKGLVNGRCPVPGCLSWDDSATEAVQYQQTHFQVQHQSTEYCGICFQWVIDHGGWDNHCRAHLEDLSLRCDLLVFRHATARPGLCPQCLGNTRLPAGVRMQQFFTRGKWQAHISRHLCDLPDRKCHHPRCTHRTAFLTVKELRNHFADVHCVRLPESLNQKADDLGQTSVKRPRDDTRDQFGKDVDFVTYTSEQFQKEQATRQRSKRPRTARQLKLTLQFAGSSFSRDLTVDDEGNHAEDKSWERPEDSTSCVKHDQTGPEAAGVGNLQVQVITEERKRSRYESQSQPWKCSSSRSTIDSTKLVERVKSHFAFIKDMLLGVSPAYSLQLAQSDDRTARRELMKLLRCQGLYGSCGLQIIRATISSNYSTAILPYLEHSSKFVQTISPKDLTELMVFQVLVLLVQDDLRVDNDTAIGLLIKE